MILALALVCLLPICSCSAETWGAPVNFDSMCRRETLCFLDCPFGRASDARGCEICACRMPDMSMFGDAPQLVPALEPVPELQPALQPAPQLVPARRSIPSRFLKTGNKA
ncbi:uncharacterized protein [Branchiostoma lanceolatum]|uniref:uncharacterized protein isoform X4 n=1 Tax=Branchiostoma lanceolatum TaxID=7740 RepID=UPI003451FE4F